MTARAASSRCLERVAGVGFPPRLNPTYGYGCWQQLFWLKAVAEKFFARDVLKRLALPRPDNYFGWRGRPTP